MARKYPPAEFGPSGKELVDASFNDYVVVGKKIIEWAQKGPSSWPKDMAELRAALAGHLSFPAEVKRLKVLQSDDSFDGDYEFILRLPARGQVTESEALAKEKDYKLPPIIEFLHTKDDKKGNTIDPEDLFHARVADYTMRQCR